MEQQHKISAVQSAFLHVLSLSVWTEGFTCKVEIALWRPQNSANSSLTDHWLTWSCLRSELTPVLSSAVRRGLVWRSARGSLRGLTACLHLVTAGCAGPEPSGLRATCEDIKRLNPIQSEIPELRIICRERQTSSTDWRCEKAKRGRSPHHTASVCWALWWWITAPAKYSSLLLGVLCPAEVLSLRAGAPSWPGELDTSLKKTTPEKNTLNF